MIWIVHWLWQVVVGAVVAGPARELAVIDGGARVLVRMSAAARGAVVIDGGVREL